MVIINKFSINQDGSQMQVSVETDDTFIFTSALLWTDATFKDYNESIDISSYLTQSSNIENFTINASDIGFDSFSGIYFLELQDNSTLEDDCVTCNNNLAVAATFVKYKLCLLDKVKAYEVCNNFSEKNLDSNLFDILNIETILNATMTALEFGYYGEALDSLKVLKRLCNNNCDECDDCLECQELLNPIFKRGLNYSTLDNSLILE